MLQIRLLGEFAFAYQQQPVPGVQTKRLQSLLAYLLLHTEQRIARRQLAFLFWPDSSEKQAQTNLRRQLHFLRKAFPPIEHFITVDDKNIQWSGNAAYTLDVADFAQHYNAVNEALTEDYNDASTHLEAVIACYKGPLVPNCYDDWILPVREQLDQQYLAAADRLLQIYEETGDYAAAIRCGELLIRHDPLREDAYQRLMRLQMLNGDRASALRIFHTCASVLEQELGVAPNAETAELYANLLKLDTKGGAAQVLALQEDVTQQAQDAPLRTDAALVGRQKEWQQVLASWHTSARGKAQLLLIMGEAGIGKTRLAEELYHWATHQGVDAAYTRSYAAATGLAYAPVIEWLRTPSLQTRLQRLQRIWLTEVARLLPDLLEADPTLAQPQPLTERWQRQRLFQALAQAVHVSTQPLLLWLDDVQWCDQETLDWLQFLLHFDSQARLLIVGTIRSEEVTGDHPLLTLRTHLRQSDQLVEIELAHLDEAHTAQLSEQVVGRTLAHQTVANLYHLTEGNPLFIVETARSDFIHQVERQPTDRFAYNDMPPHEPLPQAHELPPKVTAILQSRLNQLSPAARELVGLAATIGRSFTFEILMAASTVDEDGLVRALDELWRRKIVREQQSSSRDYTYDFSHDRLRDVAYWEIAAIRRRLYHQRVASSLEEVYATHREEYSAQIARHYEQANMAAQARDYYRLAGSRAVTQFAHIEALHHLHNALILTNGDELVEKVEIYRLFTRVYQLQAARDAQQKILDELAELADQLNDDALRSEVWLLRAVYAEELGDYDASIAAAQQAIACAQGANDQTRQAQGYLQWGLAYWNRGQYLRAEEYYQQALEIAQAIKAREIEASALLHMGSLQTYCGAYAKAVEISQQALAVVRNVEDPVGEIWAHNQLGYQIVEQGDDAYDDAEVHYSTGLQLAREIGSRTFETRLLSNLSMLYMRRGQFSKADQCLEKSLATARETNSARQEALAINHRANLAMILGDFVGARQRFEQALHGFRQIGHRQGEGKTLSELGLLYLLQDKPTEAQQVNMQALAIAQEITIRRDQAYAWTRLGHAQAVQDKWAEATTSFQEAMIIYQETGQQKRSLEPLAGLAYVTWRQGKLAEALTTIEQILPLLKNSELDTSHDLFQVFHICCQLLHKMNDPRSGKIQKRFHHTIQQCSQHLPDNVDQTQFLACITHSYAVGLTWITFVT